MGKKKIPDAGQKVRPTTTRPKSTRRSTRGQRKPTRRATRSTTKPGELDPGLGIGRPPPPPPKTRSHKSKAAEPPTDTSLGQERTVLQSVETGAAKEEPFPSILQFLESNTEGSQSPDFVEKWFGNDPLRVYYGRIGYLPPLDDVTTETLRYMSIMMSNPSLDVQAGRVSPTNQAVFRQGLLWRMVELEPNDDEEFHINGATDAGVSYPAVPDNIKEYDGMLWEKDLEKCHKQVQEAIFQRTILISMIDRHRLFYGTKQSILEFAVETPWSCLPMPTHAERRGGKFLTCPKPDLAIGFRRQKLFQGYDWNSFPKETQKLICFDGNEPPNVDRAFYFLTIEAKGGFTSVNDPVALNQCLNNASQALHNMYEFFKEADRKMDETNVEESYYTEKFFDRVRFFSVVAVAGSLKIRIHRAERLGDKDEKGPKPDYPLKFVFADYKEIDKKDFTRQSVVEELTRILHNYGVEELAGYLREAIKKMNEKFVEYADKNKNRVMTRDPLFYSYGQAMPPARNSRTSTPGWRVAQTPSNGSRTPVPHENGRRGYQGPRSSALSQSQSISDNLVQLSVTTGAAGSAGQNESNRVDSGTQESGPKGRRKAPDARAGGSPNKKRKTRG